MDYYQEYDPSWLTIAGDPLIFFSLISFSDISAIKKG